MRPSSGELRLLEAVRALSKDPAEQLQGFPSFVVQTDELAIDFDDAMQILEADGGLDEGVFSGAKSQLDRIASIVSAEPNDPLWSPNSLGTDSRWATVRQLAREVLQDVEVDGEPTG